MACELDGLFELLERVRIFSASPWLNIYPVCAAVEGSWSLGR